MLARTWSWSRRLPRVASRHARWISEYAATISAKRIIAWWKKSYAPSSWGGGPRFDMSASVQAQYMCAIIRRYIRYSVSRTRRWIDSQPKLLDLVRAVIRSKHYSRRTEETYVDWITRYVRFHKTQHPRELGSADITAFLSHLAVDLDVAAATQNQARSALLFLYRDVLGLTIDAPRNVVAAKMPRRLPTVLTRDEVRAVLGLMSGDSRLMAQLLYGSGLRLMECLRLRVKDLDFAQHQLTIRDGKGMHDRVTMLPDALTAPLQVHLQLVRRMHLMRM